MKYQMIITDYDGTLTESGKNYIDEETLSAIKSFKDRGGKFIICSGRPISSISKIMEKYGLSGITVGLQGAVIRDTKSCEEIYAKGLNPSLAVEIIKKLKTEGGEFVVYIGDDMYFERDCDSTRIYQEMLNVKGFFVEDLESYIIKTNKPVAKIGFLTSAEKVKEIVEKYNDIYGGKGAVFNSGYKYMAEVVSPDYAKGEAVRFLSKYYDISLDKIITVGDSTNDYSLLSGEWHGVCVGDGHEDLKKIAKEITVPLKDKPIKTLIEKYTKD